ncbi:MAG: sulfatase activating formylglycine-generating enzyme, partial [Myxococcota bacterium]
SRDPAARHASAGELAAEVISWLEGAKKRDQALEVVATAAAMVPAAAHLRDEARVLREQAGTLLQAVPSWAPEADKVAGWRLEDRAAELEREADQRVVEREQLLRAALTHTAGLPEAHAALAEGHLAEHAASEAIRDAGATARSALLLEAHSASLPVGHPVRVRCETYLSGTGALSLVTDPPGAEVLLYKYELQDRRLVPVFLRSLGQTPLRELPLARGSYLCVLRAEGRAETRYPVRIGRGEHWHGIAPGDDAPRPVRLPRPDRLAAGDCHVPAGWAWIGGDDQAHHSAPRARVWVDDVVIRQHPVTNRQFIGFLDALVAAGREEEALRHAPRERAGSPTELGALLYGRDPSGGFVLQSDAEGDVWHPECPVLMVDWWGAVAFARWQSERDGLAWGLPGEWAWEKAARGVDGRFFPWGDGVDASWCSARGSLEGRPLPRPVDSFPIDVSPYGVRGMAGNVRDWCHDPMDSDAPLAPPPSHAAQAAALPASPDPAMDRMNRGGVWSLEARYSRAAIRYRFAPGIRLRSLGFRLARRV